MIKALKDIIYAMTSPEKYRDFMDYKRGRVLLHAVILVVFSGLITFSIPTASFLSAGGFGKIIREEIPDFSVSSENGFWIEDPVEIDDYSFYIKANSDVVFSDISDFDGDYAGYESIIVADREQIYIKAAGSSEIIARYDELQDFSFSKDEILNYVPLMYVVYSLVYILSWFMDFGYYLILALANSWVAGVIASFMKVRLGSKRLFHMAVYAGTTSYLLALIQVILGKSIPNYGLFSILITLGYMFFAIKEYKESGFEELPPEEFGNRED